MNGLILLIAAIAILKRINVEPSGKGSLVVWMVVGMGLFLVAVVGALLQVWR